MTQVTSAHDNDRLPRVPSIPLADERTITANGDASIGNLVKDATTHLSTLVRAEVELAKAEVTKEVKKGLKGSLFFIVALAVLLYSSFFFFFFLAELLSEWLHRWAAFGLVFLAMLVFAGLFGFLGYKKVRGIRKPERTINTVKDTAAVLTSRGHSENGHQPAHRD